MPRLVIARREALAWALARGLGPTEASRAAGYPWCGFAAKRVKCDEVRARVEELKPLLEAGAGPDELSQLLARFVERSAAKDTPDGYNVAARIAKAAFAARDKALDGTLDGAAREASVALRKPGEGAKLPTRLGVNVTMSPEEWNAMAGARYAE
ncbi:MAG TPA: hypothetical protein VG248_04940 [Caulobacteraceae bacterium]|nr:hypothetical protein [Caulobacteraceae bacterium]